MSGNAKYRYVQENPNVAFVVDEVAEDSMEGAHFLEVRGVAETTVGTHDLQGHLRQIIGSIPGAFSRSTSILITRDSSQRRHASRSRRRGGLTCAQSRCLVSVAPMSWSSRPARPHPRGGAVLVAASACDVLFVDTMIRSGHGADYFPFRPPYVPGNGIGGTIVSLGAGVETRSLDRLAGGAHRGSGRRRRLPELASVDVGDCAPVPDGIDLLEATAVLHDGTTALRVLEKTTPTAGD